MPINLNGYISLWVTVGLVRAMSSATDLSAKFLFAVQILRSCLELMGRSWLFVRPRIKVNVSDCLKRRTFLGA